MEGRAKKKLLRVTFQNGKVFCYNRVTETMIETLKEIGVDRFPQIDLELCHHPLISKEIYPRYRDWMKPICDGWYINTQSDSESKFLQLQSISDKLGLKLKIEISDKFEAQSNPNREKKKRPTEKMIVKLPNGDIFANNSATDTFLEVIWHLGVDEIMRKRITWRENPIITVSKVSNSQVQVDSSRWATVPNSTKDKAKILRIIGAMLHIQIEVTLV